MIANKRNFRLETIPDDSPDVSYLEGEALARYNNGDFGYVGVRASILLSIPNGKGVILQKITSPGLWGIESDSGDDYLALVYQEECGILADMLTELGVKVD